MNWNEYTLALTAEELGEVATEAQDLLVHALQAQKRVSKTLRFGTKEVMPGQMKDNMTRLREELLDVAICTRFLESLGIIEPIRALDVDMAVMNKRMKIVSNIRRSQDHGCLPAGEAPSVFIGE